MRLTTHEIERPLTFPEILLTAAARFAAVITLVLGPACFLAAAVLVPLVSPWFLFLLAYPVFLICVGWVIDDEEKR